MLLEQSFRYAETAYTEICASEIDDPLRRRAFRAMDGFWRAINQNNEYYRTRALVGKPSLNMRPETLTGDAWRRAWAEAAFAA